MADKATASVVDLFSGAGGLSLGAARSGFTIHSAVEVDPEPINAHKINFPHTVHLETDVSRLTGRSLRSALALQNDDLAGIIGGPPCQGFSFIGRSNKDDARNKLFLEFFRLVAEVLPKFFLVENVPGILHRKNSETVTRALSYVEDKYVLLRPMVLTASDYGAPTTRTRIFFYGYLKNEIGALTSDDFKPPTDVETVFVKDALHGLPTRINPTWQTEEQSWRVVHVHGKGYYASSVNYHLL